MLQRGVHGLRVPRSWGRDGELDQVDATAAITANGTRLLLDAHPGTVSSRPDTDIGGIPDAGTDTGPEP